MQAIQHPQFILPFLCFLLALQEKLQGFVNQSVPFVQGAQHGHYPLLTGSILAQFGLQQRLLTPANHFFLIIGVTIKHSRCISIVTEISFGSRLMKRKAECFKHHFFGFLHVLRTRQGIRHHRIIIPQIDFLQDRRSLEHFLQGCYASFRLSFTLKCIHQLHQCICIQGHLFIGEVIPKYRL